MADYIRIWSEQRGACAVCARMIRAESDLDVGDRPDGMVDWDPEHGVRGILCRKCATLVGLCHADVVVAERLTGYLSRALKGKVPHFPYSGVPRAETAAETTETVPTPGTPSFKMFCARCDSYQTVIGFGRYCAGCERIRRKPARNQ